jgi:hypothetical protein
MAIEASPECLVACRLELEQPWGSRPFDLVALFEGIEFDRDIVTDLHFTPVALGMFM